MFVEENPSTDLQDLRKIREDRGLSLEDLYKKTRIRVVYLRAIESKNFDLLPAPVYSRNFIKMYADALGIDREKMIKEYQDFLASRKEISPQVEHVKQEKFSFIRLAGRKYYLLLVLMLFIIIVAALFIDKQHQSFDLAESPDIHENLPKNPGDADFNAGSSIGPKQSTGFLDLMKEDIRTRSQVGTTFSSDRESGLLMITATDETWLRVKIDENPPFQILLKAGQKFEQKAKNVSLDIGNAGGIKITFKGKDIERLGQAGEVIHLRLP